MVLYETTYLQLATLHFDSEPIQDDSGLHTNKRQHRFPVESKPPEKYAKMILWKKDHTIWNENCWENGSPFLVGNGVMNDAKSKSGSFNSQDNQKAR